MTRYRVKMEIPEGKIDEIMTRLENAQEEIYKCYDELAQLGVLNVIPADDEISKNILWGMQCEEGSQTVEMFSMNDQKKISIHGKQEAEFFCKTLMEYFR